MADPGPSGSLDGPRAESTAVVSSTAEAIMMGRGSRLVYQGLRRTAWLIGRTVFRISVTGLENVPSTGGYILAPGGHRSILDTPLAALASPRVLRFMGAENYFKIPGLGRFLRAMGGFPVERSMTDRMALRLAEEILRNGEPLVVFAEGTRQVGPLVQPLKEGAAFLACRASVPIVPVGLGGAERAMPKGARFIRPSKVVVIVGPPIHPPARGEGRRVRRSAVTDLSARLHHQLQELFDEAQIRAGA